MSNPYRKDVPDAADDSAEVASLGQHVDLITAATDKLYAAKGGSDIDIQIELARENVQIALACRKAEAARLAKDPNAVREKGERPLVSVSEDRLHSRELSRLLAQRDDLRLLCRNSVMEIVRRRGPRTVGELRKAIAMAVKDVDFVTNTIVAQAESDRQNAQPLIVAASRFVATQPEGVLPLEKKQALQAAIERHDPHAIMEVVRQLAPQAFEAFRYELEQQMAA